MDDSPAPRLAELLRHPDDLDKIPSLKHDFSRKKAAVDSQLRTGLREQLEMTQSGMNGLSDGQKTVQAIKDEMMRIDVLCSESQTMIRDFASINLVSQAHRNFGAVEAMRRDLETFGDRVSTVEEMLRQDDEDKENMPNLLPCHRELTLLRNIRDDAMEQIKRADDPGLEATLEDYFARLDDTIDWFDEHVGLVALNLVNLVVNDNNGLVVRFAVAEEFPFVNGFPLTSLPGQESLRRLDDFFRSGLLRMTRNAGQEVLLVNERAIEKGEPLVPRFAREVFAQQATRSPALPAELLEQRQCVLVHSGPVEHEVTIPLG
jgi:hypothetical protein